MAHQAKTWRFSERAQRKAKVKAEEKVGVLEKSLLEKEQELIAAHAELQELRAEKEVQISKYMDSEEFYSFIDKHDDMVFATAGAQAWDKCLSTILAKHPGVFDPADFPAPMGPSLDLTTTAQKDDSGDISGGDGLDEFDKILMSSSDSERDAGEEKIEEERKDEDIEDLP